MIITNDKTKIIHSTNRRGNKIKWKMKNEKWKIKNNA